MKCRIDIKWLQISHHCYDTHTQDGTIAASQRLPLRQEFVHSLCIAEQLGVLRSIEHIAKSLHGRRQPGSPSSMATVEANLEAISTTDNSSILEDGQKLNECVHPEGVAEPTKASKDDTSQKDSDSEEKSCTSRPNEKLSSSKSDTVDSKMKAAATGVVTESGSKKLRYYGAGVGTFLT